MPKADTEIILIFLSTVLSIPLRTAEAGEQGALADELLRDIVVVEEFLDTTGGQYMNNDRFAERIDVYRSNGGNSISERVDELASEKVVTMAQISLAWLLHQDAVDAPIIGTTSIEHLEDAVEALDISLSDSDPGYLEEPYAPVEINGHQ